MKSFTKTKFKKESKPTERGYVLYDGPSQLDGKPIICIATLKTSNRKTGDMVQTWIMRSDINPVEASQTGDDASVCGTCPHKPTALGSCYVNLGQAPNQVFNSFHREIYPRFDAKKHGQHISNRKIRLGAYGDPAAVPFEVMAEFAKLGIGHTGYTHQHTHKHFDNRYFSLVMASADTPKQSLKLQALGAKTFRVALPDDGLFDHEIECLSDSDGINCADCLKCDGQTQNIAIAVHGSRSKKFKSNLIETVEIAA